MNYFAFLFRKTIKNWGNLVPILILILGIASLYIINITSGDYYSYTNTTKDDLNQTRELEEYYLEELASDTNYSKEDIQSFKDGLQDISEQRRWNEQILKLAGEEKWSEALSYSLKILNRHIDVQEKSDGKLFPSEYILALHQEIALYEKLISLDQEPDTTGYETFGLTYLFRVMDSIFPLFFILILSVLLTELFSNTYKKGISIERLLPNRYANITFKKIIYGTVLGIGVYLLTLAFSFILATVINGAGNIQYPIAIYSSGSQEVAPIWLVMIKMLALQILSILNMTFLISLISFLAKNRLTTLFLSIILTIGSSIALKSIELMHPIIHLNPFTYFSGGAIVTHYLAYNLGNSNLTFGNGLIALITSTILFAIVLFVFINKTEKKQLIGTRRN